MCNGGAGFTISAKPQQFNVLCDFPLEQSHVFVGIVKHLCENTQEGGCNSEGDCLFEMKGPFI